MRDVVQWINQESGRRYELRERFPVGTEGAWLVEDPSPGAGGPSQLVLKLEPGVEELESLLVMLRTLERLRARGYPAPRYVHAGVHPHPPVGRYTLQELLPGGGTPRIDDALLDQVFALNDLQADVGPPELIPEGGWRHFIVSPILEDQVGGAATKNDAMKRYSPETAALLECLRDYVRAHPDAPMATVDVVHEDFHKDHIWTEIVPDPDVPKHVHPGRITGIIDFEGIVTGDRVFDLVTLLSSNTGLAYRAGPHRRLWDRACALAGVDTVGVYLANLIHREVGYCARWAAPPERMRRSLDTAETHLAELQTRTAYRLRPWRR